MHGEQVLGRKSITPLPTTWHRNCSAKTKRGRVGETARARGYLRPPTAGYFYIDILARAAARGRRPEGCGAGSYRQYRPIGRSPKPKFGRGDGRLGDRPAVAPSGWRETAVPMRGHRHHSRIGRANALTGRHARPSCPSSWPPASQQRGFSSLPHDHAWPAHLFSGPNEPRRGSALLLASHGDGENGD